MGKPIIEVRDVGKSYRLGRVGASSLRDEVERLFSSRKHAEQQEKLFWALKNVSFNVQPGEVVGVIGRNGAGKSTLLKILSRITAPTQGEITLRGRTASLLEVGTGFHPELTGRENVYLNGAILGMRKKEIDAQYEEIVEFAEIRKFIETPVKRYSSGMYVRLAFAVAAHLRPEILIVDEVLAVGDISFQEKCLGKMRDVTSKGRTVLFVSHKMQSVLALCQRCIFLDAGGVLLDASAREATHQYHAMLNSRHFDANSAVDNETMRRGNGVARFNRIAMLNEFNEEIIECEPGETIRFRLGFEIRETVSSLRVTIGFREAEGGNFVTTAPTVISRDPVQPCQGEVTMEFPNFPMRVGQYPVYFSLGDEHFKPYDVVDGLQSPLIVNSVRSARELGYDPAKPSGKMSIAFNVQDIKLGEKGNPSLVNLV